MKKILFILLFCLISNVPAATFVTGSLVGGQGVEGELIEVYSDRWFYEADSSDTPKYVLLFNNIDETFSFSFFPMNSIAELGVVGKGKSEYKELLKKRNLFFKNDLVEDADVLTGNEGHHKYEKMFGNFAWDIGILDERGSQYKGLGKELNDFYVFGKEVVSPLSGVVVGKVDGQEDNVPDLSFSSSLAGKENNYLTIKVDENIYLSIVHFQKNTITVEIGETVEVGQVLGKVGNSGISYLPHLHYTLYAYIPEYNRFISIPGFFEN